MNKQEIMSRLQNKNLDFDVIYLESVDSTNNFAKGYNNTKNLLVAAKKQTGGRGRYGKSFASPEGKGLYFTLRINMPPQNPVFFPLIAAMAVSCAVSSLCGIELDIKWPNDLLYKTDDGYKKLCGILVEASGGSASYIIVGIGVNINNDITDFPDELKNIVSSLKIISGKEYDLTGILCETVDEFMRLMYISSEELLEEYRTRLLLGVDISFAQDGTIYKGRAAGINENGNLIAKLENGEEIIIQSGEIGIL